MIKMFTYRRIALVFLLVLLSFILKYYPVQINENINNIDCCKYPIYLIDENDFVAMTSINDNSNDVLDKVSNIIDGLTVNSKIEVLDGFKKIIPKNTKLLDVSLNDGMLKINFSHELLNVSIDMEEKMIEAIIYSLTEIKEINKVMIFVEGNRLIELPNSKKKLDIYLDRSYGINKIINIDNIKNTSMTTIYYLAKNQEYYYIPVSIISNDEDKINVIIKNLKSNTLNNSNLLSHLNYQVDLMNYMVNDKEIVLDFNDVLLDSIKDGNLEEEIKYAISYSIRDSMEIDNIVFLVNGNKIDEYLYT